MNVWRRREGPSGWRTVRAHEVEDAWVIRGHLDVSHAAVLVHHQRPVRAFVREYKLLHLHEFHIIQKAQNLQQATRSKLRFVHLLLNINNFGAKISCTPCFLFPL